jgi:hypothetical protein
MKELHLGTNNDQAASVSIDQNRTVELKRADAVRPFGMLVRAEGSRCA